MSYYVYVIRLDDAVLQSQRFQRQNPQMKPGFPCFYVGQSSHSPETRFWQHKNGYKSNRFVQEFGLGLCPQFYEMFNPISTRREAEHIEEMLTQNLRMKGYGVWSN
jgi:hypothetical protein